MTNSFQKKLAKVRRELKLQIQDLEGELKQQTTYAVRVMRYITNHH